MTTKKSLQNLSIRTQLIALGLPTDIYLVSFCLILFLAQIALNVLIYSLTSFLSNDLNYTYGISIRI